MYIAVRGIVVDGHPDATIRHIMWPLWPEYVVIRPEVWSISYMVHFPVLALPHAVVTQSVCRQNRLALKNLKTSLSTEWRQLYEGGNDGGGGNGDGGGKGGANGGFGGCGGGLGGREGGAGGDGGGGKG